MGCLSLNLVGGETGQHAAVYNSHAVAELLLLRGRGVPPIMRVAVARHLTVLC